MSAVSSRFHPYRVTPIAHDTVAYCIGNAIVYEPPLTGYRYRSAAGRLETVQGDEHKRSNGSRARRSMKRAARKAGMSLNRYMDFHGYVRR